MDELYDLELIRKSYLYFYEDYPEDEIKSSQIIVIGKTNGNTMICIGVTNKNQGQIFLWDWDFEVTEQAENLQSLFDFLELDESVL